MPNNVTIHDYFAEARTHIIGGPDMFVDVGSMLNLSCVVSHTPTPPSKVKWVHEGQGEISFRGPRNGVSVSTNIAGFIFVRTIFVQNGKWSPFLELTPTHFDKCHETSRIFPRTEQTFASARSFGVIS